jgi:hypothetical protein
VDEPDATVLDAVQTAVEDYDDALAAGDTDRATAWFDPVVATTRFGPEGEQWGIEEVAAVRATVAPTGLPTVVDEEARRLGQDVVLHLRVIDRDGRVVQRSQLWRRAGPDGAWRIVHAHVSTRAVGS